MDTTNNDLHADTVIDFVKGGKSVSAAMGRIGNRVVLVDQSDGMYGHGITATDVLTAADMTPVAHA
jgi:hypothetical protein